MSSVDRARQDISQPGPTIHQHPLGYLVGLEGVALMRAFAGEYDSAFTQARIAEIRSLLDRADEFGPAWDLAPLSTETGYQIWVETYDGEDNGAFPLEDEVLLPLLDRLIPGTTLDVACGTGRTSRQLIRRGHRVLGFDTSSAMLAQARTSVPEASFAEADLTSLPVDDASADHVVCTLALTHQQDLVPFFAEAARVLRPGGHLVTSDIRGNFIGSPLHPLVKQNSEGVAGYIPQWQHDPGAYLRAALPHGFIVRACEEPLRPLLTVDPDESPDPLNQSAPPDIWSLHTWVADAANAARATTVGLIIWDFERA